MFLADYHVHTNFSGDSKTPPEDMIKKAIEKGLPEIMFTDHVDYDYPVYAADGYEILSINYDEYFPYFEKMKEKFGDKIEIKIGVEMGLQEQIKEKADEFFKKYKFDFIIGSSHCADRFDLCRTDFFKGKSKLEAYTRYFENVLENVKLYPEINVYGHLDYVSRYGIYDDNRLFYSEYSEIIDEILKNLISSGRGIEINTSGFRYGMNTVYPQFEIVKRFKELGGEILTIGSDAHSAEYIADHFEDAYRLAKEAGFDKIALFKNKEPVFKKFHI